MALELPRIELSEGRKKELATKFKCTTQAVRNALKYQSDSDQARAIRKAAKSILLKDAKNITINIK